MSLYRLKRWCVLLLVALVLLVLIPDEKVQAADPFLTWNTFLGGSGSGSVYGSGDDIGWDIATDASGNVYITGESGGTWGSPLRAISGGGHSDAFVAKLHSSGSLLWNTFLGGSGNVYGNGDDIGWGIAVDASGNVYITGSSDGTWGSPLRAISGDGGSDAFVAKLNSSGSLLWNTFLGGSFSDKTYGIAADASGNVYITGESHGTWGSPLQASSGGVPSDAFVAKLNSSGSLLWNTFLGGSGSGGVYGSGSDIGWGIATDASGNVYITGESLGTWGSPLRAYNIGAYGSTDAFVAKLNSSGSLLWNTFLGGSGGDLGRGIAADASGNVYITGSSKNFYITGSSDVTWGSPLQAYSGSDDAFVVKLNSSGSLLWNTFLGGSGSDTSYGIAVDASGIYITGESGGTWGSPLQASSGSWDAFVVKLNSSGSLLWNTFLGGSGGDLGRGIAADASGIYITGFSSGTWGSPLQAYSGSDDAFVVKLNYDTTSSPLTAGIVGGSVVIALLAIFMLARFRSRSKFAKLKKG